MRSEAEREALAAEFDRHAEEEGGIVREYQTLSAKLPDGPLSVLVNHILTEEEMHHFLLRTLSDWLRSPPGAGGVRTEAGLDRDAILRATRMLREHEEQTIESCRGLRSRLSGEEGEIFEGLLEAIALDSEKHDRLLAIVEKAIGG